jgi:hypothetical protein
MSFHDTSDFPVPKWKKWAEIGSGSKTGYSTLAIASFCILLMISNLLIIQLRLSAILVLYLQWWMQHRVLYHGVSNRENTNWESKFVKNSPFHKKSRHLNHCIFLQSVGRMRVIASSMMSGHHFNHSIFLFSICW